MSDWMDPTTYGLPARIAITAGMFGVCFGLAAWELHRSRRDRRIAEEVADGVVENQLSEEVEWRRVCSHVRDLARRSRPMREQVTRSLYYMMELERLYSQMCAVDLADVYANPCVRGTVQHRLSKVDEARRVLEVHAAPKGAQP